MDKEIEYSREVPDLAPYTKAAAALYPQKQIYAVIERSIYKNDSSYFVRISTELEGGSEKIVFSLKEDLLKQGITSGLKEAKEVNMIILPEQLPSILAILEMLGYKQESQFAKERLSYILEDARIDLDTYHIPDGTRYNVEVEGASKEVVMALAEKLGIVG